MGQILSSVCTIDFGSSFLRFSSTRVQHTPRLRVDSVCTLIDTAGAARRYFLSCPCIAESMYLPSNRWDYAELAIRQPTPLHAGASARTLHYSLLR